MNGHSRSSVDERSESSSLVRPGTESPLSDVNDLPTTTAPTNGAQHGDVSEDDAMHDMATSELEEDDQDGDDNDADFDEETPPPEHANGNHDASSSEDDVRSGKRKITANDDTYMKQNPELYGLRRSVSVHFFLPCHSSSLTLLAGTCSTESQHGTFTHLWLCY
jgi:chromodomain-helicase-DNA-binding protein 1